MLEVGSDQQKILRCWTKYTIFADSLSILSLQQQQQQQPFYGPLDFVQDYSGEPVPER